MTLLRRAGRLTLWVLAALLALFLVQVGLLAFPQILVSQEARSGEVVINYDGPRDPDLDELAAEVNQRLQSSGLYERGRDYRVFFLRDQNLYTVFSRLAMVPPKAQGFALSLVGNAFVSESRVAALGARTGGLPRYSVWEGDPAHTIAHELAHLQVTQGIGRKRWKDLPHWKREGLPEYIANIGSIRDDSRADLRSRFRTLRNDRRWSSPQGWDRAHYEAGLLVEFLIEVRGHALNDILADDVTRNETVAELGAWAKAQEH